MKILKNMRVVICFFFTLFACATVQAGNGSGNEPPALNGAANQSFSFCSFMSFLCSMDEGNGSGNEPPALLGNGSGNEPPAFTQGNGSGNEPPLFIGNGSGNEPPAN